jgi:hypothetical protein
MMGEHTGRMLLDECRKQEKQTHYRKRLPKRALMI